MEASITTSVVIPGGPKKRPELCVTITARILYGAKFPLAHWRSIVVERWSLTGELTLSCARPAADG